MEMIKLTINGKEVTGKKGDTILTIAAQNGIDIIRKGRSLPHLVLIRSITMPDMGSSRASQIVEIVLIRPYAVPESPRKLIIKYCLVEPIKLVRLLIP